MLGSTIRSRRPSTVETFRDLKPRLEATGMPAERPWREDEIGRVCVPCSSSHPCSPQDVTTEYVVIDKIASEHLRHLRG